MEADARRAAAIAAAVDVAATAGYPTPAPVVLQDTNNIVVRMAPHDVVAKVGVWPHSAAALGLEVDVCAHLGALDAPVASPIGPLRSGGAGSLPVSLWHRLPSVPQPRLDDGALALMLRRVHAALSSRSRFLDDPHRWATHSVHKPSRGPAVGSAGRCTSPSGVSNVPDLISDSAVRRPAPTVSGSARTVHGPDSPGAPYLLV
jgi:hypothetical protein